jgi:hypothetical protein
MKTLKIIMLLICLSPVSLSALLPITTDVNHIISDMEEISKLFPRREGSAEEKALVDFIMANCRDPRWTLREETFDEAPGYHSFSRIITLEIPGRRADTLIITLPLTPGESENNGPNRGGAMNLALALALVRELKTSIPPVTLQILFLGAETSPLGGENPYSAAYPLGTQYFLSGFFPEQPAAFLCLDLGDNPGPLSVEIWGERRSISPRWLIEKTAENLDRTNLVYSIAPGEFFFGSGGAGDSGALQKILAGEYSAIGLRTLPARSWGQPGRGLKNPSEDPYRDWLHSFFFFLSVFIEDNGEGFPRSQETNFQMIQWQNRTFLIPEAWYMGILILIPSLMLLYPFLARRRFKRYLLLTGRHWFLFPLVFLQALLFLFITTLTVEAILNLKQAAFLWRKFPLSFFLFKISGALFLFFLSLRVRLFFRSRRSRRFRQFRRREDFLPENRSRVSALGVFRPSYQTAMALIFLLGIFFLISAWKLSLAYPVLWALIFVLLFSLVRNRFLKVLFFLLSALWPLYLLSGAFRSGHPETLRFFLLSPLAGNTFLALAALPYILLLFRLSSLFFPRPRSKRLVRNLFLALSGAAALSSGIFLLYSPPFAPGEVQPILLRDEITPPSQEPPLPDGPAVQGGEGGAARRFFIESPAPFAIRELDYGGSLFTLPRTGRQMERSFPFLPPAPVIESQSTAFLDQREWLWTFKNPPGEAPPDLVRFFLFPQEERLMVLYSNFPYTIGAGGQVSFHIGLYPPQPLEIRVILPGETRFWGRFETERNFSLSFAGDPQTGVLFKTPAPPGARLFELQVRQTRTLWTGGEP